MGRTLESCTLTALERSVLRFHRLNDVPGLEIPSRYFQFLRTGDPTVIEGVLEHNRHDIVSLAAVMSLALQLAADGPEACDSRSEAFGLGCLYERAGDVDRGEAAYAIAAASDDEDLAVQALSRLALLLRRADRHDDAAQAWGGVLAIATGKPHLTALHERAAEALAIHYEHRSKELSVAKTCGDVAIGRAAHGGGGRSSDSASRQEAPRAAVYAVAEPSCPSCPWSRGLVGRVLLLLAFDRLRAEPLVKRSTRPSVSISFWRPVKNGWHMLQISR